MMPTTLRAQLRARVSSAADRASIGPDVFDEPMLLAGTASSGITLIDGLTLVICDDLGDIAGGPDGLIVDDSRHLSLMRLTIDGAPCRSLGVARLTPSAARFRSYVASAPGRADPSLEVERRRILTAGALQDDIVVRWWAPSAKHVSVRLDLDADFVDIFEIRGLTSPPASRRSLKASPANEWVEFIDEQTGLTTVVSFSPPPESLNDGVAGWNPHLRRGSPWSLQVSVRVGTTADGAPIANSREGATRSATAVQTSPPELGRGCRRGLGDLDALSMPDRLAPGRRLVAAGIPWFVALFGRDSLITAHQSRAFRPDQLRDTIEGLAARQGRATNAGNEEAAGKILHEVRLTPRPWLGEGTTAGARPYYGSIDATPLFVMLYGTAMRWGCSRSWLTSLLPAARAALDWMRGPADPDGDGLMEYHAPGPRSLANQSWKDSVDAVQFADGRLAEGPIAMVEVQGYAYRARRELAAVLHHLGNDVEAEVIDAEATALRALIRDRYWCAPDGSTPGYFAMALDGDKDRVDGVASNMGHLLWCDVPSRTEAGQVARHLVGPELASGWGLRTLASNMVGYNPISYHVGSVWPHDSALACEGLRRYGLDVEAAGLADDLLAAMTMFDSRLPELFGGHTRELHDTPTPYPTACRPQAWAAGVPLQLASMFLGIAPDVPNGRIVLNPHLPPSMDSLEISNIAFPGGPLSVRIERDGQTRILEAPAGLSIVLERNRSGLPA